MLAQALQRLDACLDVKKRLYAIENDKCKRKYVIRDPEEVWREIDQQEVSHYYEVLTEPCNLYLDIEWVTQNSCSEHTQKERVNRIVEQVQLRLQEQYGQQTVHVTMASASGQSPKGFKNSWHVHLDCEKVCWLNAAAVGQFVRNACINYSEVDKAPYAGTGQNWRCVGSSKFSEPQRKFKPKDRATFMACTVQQPVRSRRVIYPDVSVTRPLHCVPWVQQLANSLNCGGSPQMCSEDRCVVPFVKRQYCKHAQRVHRSNHQYAVINLKTLMWKMGCHACPDAISEWQVFEPDQLQCAFIAQTQDHCAKVCKPAVKVSANLHGAVVCNDLRSHGPPPRRKASIASMVRCSDGIYSFI